MLDEQEYIFPPYKIWYIGLLVDTGREKIVRYTYISTTFNVRKRWKEYAHLNMIYNENKYQENFIMQCFGNDIGW